VKNGQQRDSDKLAGVNTWPLFTGVA